MDGTARQLLPAFLIRLPFGQPPSPRGKAFLNPKPRNLRLTVWGLCEIILP